MQNIIIGVGGIGCSNTKNDILKTYALGSCIAVILIDLKHGITGMVHIALPNSQINPQKARSLPGYFADTGIPALLSLMAAKGCDKKGRGIIVKLAGGACVLDTNHTFDIGKRNLLAIKKILWANHMGSLVEEIGGNHSRTVSVSINSKDVLITSYGRKDLII